jgi:hypothetical protein
MVFPLNLPQRAPIVKITKIEQQNTKKAAYLLLPVKKHYNRLMGEAGTKKRKGLKRALPLALIIILSSCARNGTEGGGISEGDEALFSANDMSVIEWMFETGYNQIIRPGDSEGAYMGTFFVEGNKVHFIYESDAGFNPSIFAYKDEFDTFKLIIKSRWIGSDWYDDIAGEIIPVRYSLVEFTKEDSDISYSCETLDEIKLEGFTLNYGKVNEDNVNLRDNPSLQGRALRRIHSNEVVEVKDVGSEYMEIGNLTDYWFKIKHDNSEAWIFGYYLDFLKEMETN